MSVCLPVFLPVCLPACRGRPAAPGRAASFTIPRPARDCKGRAGGQSRGAGIGPIQGNGRRANPGGLACPRAPSLAAARQFTLPLDPHLAADKLSAAYLLMENIRYRDFEALRPRGRASKGYGGTGPVSLNRLLSRPGRQALPLFGCSRPLSPAARFVTPARFSVRPFRCPACFLWSSVSLPLSASSGRSFCSPARFLRPPVLLRPPASSGRSFCCPFPLPPAARSVAPASPLPRPAPPAPRRPAPQKILPRPLTFCKRRVLLY